MSTRERYRLLAIDGGKPVRRRKFPGRKPFGLEDATELLDVLNRQSAFFPTGEKVYKFEREFAKLYRVKHAVSSTSGTAAIHVAIGAINPDPGDEIITTPISDMGTVAPIILSNCVPVFADVEIGTFNLDADDVARKITRKTKAIIVVHCWGQPADMDRFMEISKKHNLYIIEDCAQAHLTHYKGKLVGTIGQLGAFSLQESKHLQCGDGGVTITNDDAMGKRAALFVDKGCDWSEGRKYRERYAFIAPCYRITEFQGAVLIAQLKRLKWIVERRQKLGDMLVKLLANIPGVYPPERKDDIEHSYWSFPLRIDEKVLGISPENFAKAVAAEGIPIGGNWIGKPLYLFEALAEQITYGSSHYPFDPSRQGEYREGLCPNAELAMKQLQVIGLNENWTEADINDVAKAVSKVAEYYINAHERLRRGKQKAQKRER